MQYLRRSATLRTINSVPFAGALGFRALRTVIPIVAAMRRKKPEEDDAIHNQNSISLVEKQKAIEKHIQSINKKYGRGTVIKMTDKPAKVKTCSSGLMTLDMIIGGGVPVGKMIEIYGPEGSGKTTLAWHILAEAQKPDNFIVFVDSENAMDRNYASAIGVDPDRMYLLSTESGDEAFDVMLEMIRMRSFSAMCVDSVASLVPMNEQGISMEDSVIGTQARLMSRGVRQLVHANNISGEENSCTTIFINQLRNKIGIAYGNPEVRPGGKALPYYSSLTLDVRAGKKIEGPNGEIIGHKLKIKTIKNKIYAPYRTTEVDLIYGKGICKAGCLFDAAIQMEIITQTGNYYNFDGNRLAHGRAKAIERLKQEPELMEQIEDRTRVEYESRMGLNEPLPGSTNVMDDQMDLATTLQDSSPLSQSLHSAEEQESDLNLSNA